MTVYIKIPGIQGNIQTKGYEGWTELGTVDFRIDTPTSIEVGSANDKKIGTTIASEFLLSKSLDKVSPLIIAESCAGSTAKSEVEIHFCRFNQNQAQPWLIYKLYDVLFSGFYSATLCVDAHTITGELFSLSFSNMETHYMPQSANNTAQSPIRTNTGVHSSQDGFSLLELPTIPQWVVDVAAGFGDSISMGLTDWIRTKIGSNDVVNHQSGSYSIGDVAGNVIPLAIAGKMVKWTYVAAKYGKEIKFSKDFRIAPFGNRTGDEFGKWPHYHRRGPQKPDDSETVKGQGIGRHRPWQTTKHDKSFFDRF